MYAILHLFGKNSAVCPAGFVKHTFSPDWQQVQHAYAKRESVRLPEEDIQTSDALEPLFHALGDKLESAIQTTIRAKAWMDALPSRHKSSKAGKNIGATTIGIDPGALVDTSLN